jgi:hypothetical protein
MALKIFEKKKKFFGNKKSYLALDISVVVVLHSHKLHSTQYTPQLETLFTDIAGHLTMYFYRVST